MSRQMTYPAYRPIVAAAAHRPALWRLFLGLVTIVVVLGLWIAGLLAWIGLIRGQSFFASAQSTLGLETQSPASSAIYLILIWGIGIGTLVAARLWHGRKLRSLIGPGPKTVRHFFLASMTTLAVIGALSLMTLPFSEAPSLNTEPRLWFFWLPLGLLAVAGQTLSEEILFRGYIQSQLAGRFASPVIWMLAPAILFGFAHYLPTLPTSAALGYVLIAAFFGLIAADLTARTGSLGAAWGFHFANNAMAVLFVVTEGSLTGLGLFRTQEGLDDQITLSPWLLVDMVVLLGIYLLIRRIVVR